MSNKIPASHFVDHCVENVNNEKMSDADFRTMVRNTLGNTEGVIKDYKVQIKYGICGYHYETSTFYGKSIKDLSEKINTLVVGLIDMLNAADEKDGDLRQFSPEFANGYMSLGGLGVEFGDEFLSGSVISLSINGLDLPYMSIQHSLLREKTGAS